MMTHHVIAKELDAELMLYDTEQDCVHVLNPTARRIYQLFKEGMMPDEINRCIRDEFGGSSEAEIRADIRACLDELGRKGLA